VEKIEQLPTQQQIVLLKTIDIKAAGK